MILDGVVHTAEAQKMEYVLVIQPCVPAYRKGFFCRLAARYKTYIVAGEKDFHGLHSVPVPEVQLDLNGNSKLLGLGLIWQKGVAFRSLTGFDALVMGGNLRYLSSVFLLLRARLCGMPVVWWGQARSKSLLGLKGKRWLMCLLADTVIVYSDLERDSLVNVGMEQSRVFSIRNTIDSSAVTTETSKWNKESLESFSRAQKLSGEKVILVLGRGMPKARFDLLPEVSECLFAEFPNHVFLCIGEDGSSDAAREIIGRCNPGTIRFLGRMDDERLAPYALLSHLFFYPGDVGLSLHHAFAYGLPAVIHSDSTWHMPECEIFQDMVTGFSFKRGDAVSAAQCIGGLLRMTQLEVFGNNARNQIAGNYSVDGMASRMKDAIDAALLMRRHA